MSLAVELATQITEITWAVIPPDARIGHVHLRVADLQRASKFYRGVLGFRVVLDGQSTGLPVVFLAAGDYHHHIALSAFHSTRRTPPLKHTGLHHFAIVYPDELSLARAVARVLKFQYTLDDTRDHGCTLSAYLRDPDGNGIELYYDRPRSEWFGADGRLVIKSEPFDVKEWLDSVWRGNARMGAGSDIRRRMRK